MADQIPHQDGQMNSMKLNERSPRRRRGRDPSSGGGSFGSAFVVCLAAIGMFFDKIRQVPPGVLIAGGTIVLAAAVVIVVDRKRN